MESAIGGVGGGGRMKGKGGRVKGRRRGREEEREAWR